MKFDIVTPSLNQFRYIQETIDSVLKQEGPGVEVFYYVLDGGSTDGSADFIRSCESNIAYWRSGKDGGQAAAVAEGLEMGDGEIVAWIGSGSMYPRRCFQKVAYYFLCHPEVDAIYGDCFLIDRFSRPVGLTNHIPVSWQDLFETLYRIDKGTTFVRRRIYEKVGGIAPSLSGAMNYDFWLRLFHVGRVRYFPEILGIQRVFPNQRHSLLTENNEEIQKIREGFAKRNGVSDSPWPCSREALARLKSKWEHHWAPVLKWVRGGCEEKEFRGAVCSFWRRYSQSGVFAVMGVSSLGWLGSSALYILDKDAVGTSIEWSFTCPFPRLGCKRLIINIDEKSLIFYPQEKFSVGLKLSENKRFTLVRIVAERPFALEQENRVICHTDHYIKSAPLPKGKEIISVQSIPNITYAHDDSHVKPTESSVLGGQDESGLIEWEKKTSLGKKLGKRDHLRVAYFCSQPKSIGSGNSGLVYSTARSLIARGFDARVYVMNAHMERMSPFFVKQLPTLPLERPIERMLARISGWNDILFPSTALLRFRRWIGAADIWHFHNLHDHYVSLPLLGLASWTKRVVLSPVDQYLSTGHCPYTLDCEQYLTGCGPCPRTDEPYPGIGRDSTHALWYIKRLFFRLSKVNIFFHTEALAKHYHETFVGQKGTRVIPYGIDVNCFQPLPRSECALRFGVEPNNRFTVGLLHSFVLDPRKGILPIVEKLGVLAEQLPGKIGLLVVGHGSEAVRDVVPHDLSVTVLPYLHHAHELANALNLCDVLLYPTQAENLSLTCLCALACGVPVISYDVGGQKEAIKNEVNGFIVDINDYDGMFKAVLQMIENPDLCRRLSEGARSTAVLNFDFDRYTDDLIRYYYEVI